MTKIWPYKYYDTITEREEEVAGEMAMTREPAHNPDNKDGIFDGHFDMNHEDFCYIYSNVEVEGAELIDVDVAVE